MKYLLLVIFLLTACANSDIEKSVNKVGDLLTQNDKKQLKVNLHGQTIVTRFDVPKGFERVPTTDGSMGDYLQNLPLKPHNTPVYYYNGDEKGNKVHSAVIDLDVGKRDLQQCADAVMRLRAEYLYQNEQYDKIHFNFTNGFQCAYNSWRKGKRIKIKGNKTWWENTTTEDNSYDTFRKYLNQVYMYAGTASLAKELVRVPVKDMQIGDVFIIGGFPGHAITVVDMAEDKNTGKQLFMMAQSYMPAQDIHILKNFNNATLSPWYKVDFGSELITPEWTFSANDLKRFRE